MELVIVFEYALVLLFSPGCGVGCAVASEVSVLLCATSFEGVKVAIPFELSTAVFTESMG